MKWAVSVEVFRILTVLLKLESNVGMEVLLGEFRNPAITMAG